MIISKFFIIGTDCPADANGSRWLQIVLLLATIVNTPDTLAYFRLQGQTIYRSQSCIIICNNIYSDIFCFLLCILYIIRLFNIGQHADALQ